MDISPDGLAAIQGREGTVLTMYRDSAGLPTIGTGHLLTKDELSSGRIALGQEEPVDWHQGLTPEQATTLLAQDTLTAVQAVNQVTVPLTQPQFDALVSFTFNVGTHAFLNSTLFRLLNQGQYDSVPVQLRRWTYSAGQIDPGLVHRRESEITQWETP